MNITEWFPEFKVSAEADTDLHKYFVRTNHVDAIFLRGKMVSTGKKRYRKNSNIRIFQIIRPTFPWSHLHHSIKF